MFCTNCGSQIPDDSVYCPTCGAAQVPAAPQAPSASEIFGESTTTSAAQQPVSENYNYAPAYGNAQLNQDPVSTGDWVLSTFLIGLPIVGLVLLFVWAFSNGTKPSKRTWARANLIWILVAIVLMVVIVLILGATGVFTDLYNQAYMY